MYEVSNRPKECRNNLFVEQEYFHRYKLCIFLHTRYLLNPIVFSLEMTYLKCIVIHKINYVLIIENYDACVACNHWKVDEEPEACEHYFRQT